MAEYLLYFNQQWVGDHTEEWFRGRGPLAMAVVDGERYLVSMLGPESNWVRNVEAAHGDAVLRQGRRRSVRLVAIPVAERAPILREYVQVATSGRNHLPVAIDAPLAEFEEIADRYPVYRIDPS